MAFDYQYLVNLARVPLNDEDKARYPDSMLLRSANHAIMTLAEHRPDLFIGQYGNLPDGEAVLTDLVPVPAGYVSTVANYVTGQTQMIDDEHANSGSAAAFMQLVSGEVPG